MVDFKPVSTITFFGNFNNRFEAALKLFNVVSISPSPPIEARPGILKLVEKSWFDLLGEVVKEKSFVHSEPALSTLYLVEMPWFIEKLFPLFKTFATLLVISSPVLILFISDPLTVLFLK